MHECSAAGICGIAGIVTAGREVAQLAAGALAVEVNQGVFRVEVEGGADVEMGGHAKGGSGGVVAIVHATQDADEADGVHIPDAGEIGVVAGVKRITGEGEDVVDAEGVRAEQVRLDRHQVAVASGEVDDRLQVKMVAQEAGKGEAAHTYAGHGAVGDVDKLDTQALEMGGAVENLGGVEALGRV